MKAAVFYGAKDFRVENIEVPKMEPTDVLVRVKACGICGSDVHTYKKGILARPGFVMGHEFSGEVAEVGKKVKGINTGDRVVAMIVPTNEAIRGCGQCFWCTPGTAAMVPIYCPKAMRRMRLLQVRAILDVRQNATAHVNWLRQKWRLCRVCAGSGRSAR